MGLWSLVEMGNVLQKDKQQQIVTLGRLGWPLRRIEEATGVRRKTISAYLKAAGIAVRGRGRPGERPAKPAISSPAVSTDPPSAAAVASPPERAPSASACEPYRSLIDEALSRGRNAMAIWQDLVDDHGFTARYASVKRYVAVLRTPTSPEARVVITTEPGEDYGEPDVMVSARESKDVLPSPERSRGTGRTHNTAYKASSHASTSVGIRRTAWLDRHGVPADSSAWRFIDRSACT